MTVVCAVLVILLPILALRARSRAKRWAEMRTAL